MKTPRSSPKRIHPGDHFTRLTVACKVGRTSGGSSLWLCRCTCGKTTKANTGNLRSGRHRSCGCLGRDTHPRSQAGWSDTPTYSTWQSLKDPHRKAKVDPRWSDFLLFLADMGKRPSPEHHLIRKDRRLSWSKSNAVWSVLWEHKTPLSETLGISLREAARQLGVSAERARQLHHAGRLTDRLNRANPQSHPGSC